MQSNWSNIVVAYLCIAPVSYSAATVLFILKKPNISNKLSFHSNLIKTGSSHITKGGMFSFVIIKSTLVGLCAAYNVKKFRKYA